MLEWESKGKPSTFPFLQLELLPQEVSILDQPENLELQQSLG
jgi:hypothetical protein